MSIKHDFEKTLLKLPPELKREVEDFAEFLLTRQTGAPKRVHHLKQKWAGALKGYSNRYTSLELQKKALDWRDS